MVLRKINDVLDKTFGIRIEKSLKTNIKPQNTDEPIFIEFIGPSGVGKTTLFKKMKELNKNNSWIGIKEYYKFKANKGKYNRDFKLYESLIDYKIKNISQADFDAYKKLRLLSFFYKKLKEELFARSTNDEFAIVLEDGIFHNFTPEFIRLSEEKSDSFKRLLQKRAFVFLHAPPEYNARNILKRKKETGAIRPQHEKLNNEELISRQTQVLRTKQKLITIIDTFEIPILKIDTSEDLMINAQKINGFIEELR